MVITAINQPCLDGDFPAINLHDGLMTGGYKAMFRRYGRHVLRVAGLFMDFIWGIYTGTRGSNPRCLHRINRIKTTPQTWPGHATDQRRYVQRFEVSNSLLSHSDPGAGLNMFHISCMFNLRPWTAAWHLVWGPPLSGGVPLSGSTTAPETL